MSKSISVPKVKASTVQGVKVAKALLLGSLTMASLSCVTAGDDFKSDISWLKEGQTKQDDVRMILGSPRSVGNSSGSPTWTYGYYRYFLVGDSYTKELKIYWKPDGTISHYSFNSSFPDDKGSKKTSDKGAKSDKPMNDGF